MHDGDLTSLYPGDPKSLTNHMRLLQRIWDDRSNGKASEIRFEASERASRSLKAPGYPHHPMNYGKENGEQSSRTCFIPGRRGWEAERATHSPELSCLKLRSAKSKTTLSLCFRSARVSVCRKKSCMTGILQVSIQVTLKVLQIT